MKQANMKTGIHGNGLQRDNNGRDNNGRDNDERRRMAAVALQSESRTSPAACARVYAALAAMLILVAGLFAPAMTVQAADDGDAAFDAASPDSTTGSGYYVYDFAYLLSPDCDSDSSGSSSCDMSRDLEIEEKASGISTKHNVGVYIVTVDDYTDFGYSDIDRAADDIYLNGLHFGMGDERDGIMLLLSMSGRDYSLYTYGKNARYAFSDYATGQLEKTFLDDFGDNDWYSGFTHYLNTCDDYLTQADNGHPVASSKLKPMLIILVISAGLSLVICLIVKSKNKSVAKGTSAGSYAGQLALDGQRDQFTHVTVERTLIESDSSSSSGSSVSHTSSGGSSRSGKF